MNNNIKDTTSLVFVRGKNLFDNTFIQMRDGAPSTTRIEGKKISLENIFDTPQAISLSNNLNLNTYKWSVNIKTDTGGNYDYDSGWIENANNWTVSQSRISEFMGRGNAEIYFVIAKKDGTNINVSEMNNYNFQIEVGTTATTYEPYVEKEILIKNKNGVFEKFLGEQKEIIEIVKTCTTGQSAHQGYYYVDLNMSSDGININNLININAKVSGNVLFLYQWISDTELRIRTNTANADVILHLLYIV